MVMKLYDANQKKLVSSVLLGLISAFLDVDNITDSETVEIERHVTYRGQ